MIPGMIRDRNGRVAIPDAGRPENPVEAGVAVATIHRSSGYAPGVLWLEPAYVLAFVPHEAIDIAVLDRTGEVLQVHSGVDPSGATESSVGLRSLMGASIAIVARDGLLRDVVSAGMVLFWQDRPMLPLKSQVDERNPETGGLGDLTAAYKADMH
jgi:hypothetical protein